MPRGDSLKRYWESYNRGEVALGENHGVRGKDKPGTMRKVSSTDKTVAKRYYEKTGRTMDVEMADQKAMVQMMFDTASEIEDPETRFNALERAQNAQAKFNQTWLPYTEQKLGVLQSTTTLEDKISLEDALNETDDS